MKIATEILGVKGLKAHNNWSQQRLYTEWLQISMVLIFIWDDLTSYWFRNFKNRFVPSQPHTSYFKRCFKYNKAWVWNCKSHDLCSAVSFKAQVCWSNFGSFCQKSVISSVRQVPMVIFSLPYFAKPYQSSKVYIIPPWGRTNLCQLWNLTDFSNYDLKENVNQENSISLSKCKSLMKKEAKIFAFYIVVKWK